MNDSSVVLPVPWLLGCIGVLGTVICTLASIIYASLSARIAAQDKIIKRLQADIERMAKGCGAGGCLWKSRL